ncbi:hypothetical protein ACTWPB_11075 [Nocardia sp. IBHARD005]|uniref:hypothetical protein n=1 Tax=Nocardia sp. IBHARD005 TaxID=3457765 RepID=UPI004059FDB1
MGFLMNNAAGDADPQHLRAFQRLMGAVDSLASLRMRSENTTIEELCAVPVTDEFMNRLAASPTASVALQMYAQRVVLGEARWNDIELWANPVPPEVAQLKASPRYDWLYRPVAKPTPPNETVRALTYGSVFRRGEIVGPSDDDDDNTPQSWLV